MFDFDDLWSLAGGDRVLEATSEIAKLLYMASLLLAECGDEPARELLTCQPGFAYFLAHGSSAGALTSRKQWAQLQAEVDEHWATVTEHIKQAVSWRGDPRESDIAAPDDDEPFTAPWKAAEAPRDTSQQWPDASYGSGQTSGLAIAAFVLAFVAGFGILPVIFGHAALSDIRRTGKSGRGLAIAALVLGYIELALLAAAILVGIAVARR